MPRVKPKAIEVQKALKGIKYPADREALLKQARQNKADEGIISLIEDLKENNFKTPAEVSKAVGK
ncbi:MAG TPA: DUF2795 domain-containing protein [Lentimicrobium sp.]|nr:DUF2795 domain-containing protein [Lentimicrobium sp.]